MRTTSLLILATLSWVAAPPGAAIRAAESAPARLVATEASGIVPVDNERKVALVGVSGEIFVRVAKPGEIRFQSRKKGGPKEESPLAVWLEGGGVRLASPEGAPAEARTVEIAVGPGIDVEIETDGSRVGVSSVQGSVSVAGRDLTVEFRGIQGHVSLEAEQSTAVLENTVGDVTVRARDADLRIAGVTGSLLAGLERGRMVVANVREADLDSDAAPVQVTQVFGPLRLEARGGSVEVSEAKKGGELELSAAVVQLEKLEGDFTISTDADVAFKDCKASFHIDSYGGSLRGTRNEGLLEVRTRNAEVALGELTGPLRIQGDGLRVNVDGIAGDIFVDAATSDVTVARARGKVELVADRGDVVVRESLGTVDIRSRVGDVLVEKARGPVNVSADGALVDVSWEALDNRGDSLIRNESGAARLTLPQAFPVRVDATSRRGRVDSSVARITVSDDGRSARGQAGAGGGGMIRVDAEMDVEILGAGSGAGAGNEN